MLKTLQYGQYRAHPAADWFPLLTSLELAELAKDIAEHGQHEPIMVWRGQLVDGRNRWRACERAGVEPRVTFVEYESEERNLDNTTEQELFVPR